MKIIAWDKATDTAVMPERAPNDGEWCFIDKGNGKTIKKQWKTPVEMPEVALPKLVAPKDILQAFPLGTKRKLEDIRKNADYANVDAAVKGDTADLLLTIIQSGNPVNVNSPEFDKMILWLKSENLVSDDDVAKIK